MTSSKKRQYEDEDPFSLSKRALGEVVQQEEESADDHDPAQIYCVCQQPFNNRFMLACDKCTEWFHGDCVGVADDLTTLPMETIAQFHWYCPSCREGSTSADVENISKEWTDKLKEQAQRHEAELNEHKIKHKLELDKMKRLLESNSKKLEQPVLGIDLGTACSSVGVFRNGKVELIPNEDGSPMVHSYLTMAFHSEHGIWKHLIGSDSKNCLEKVYQRTIFGSKRLIGKCSLEDSQVKSDLQYSPFNLVNANGSLMFLVEHDGGERTISCVEVCCFLLTKMRRMAERKLGQSVRDAVLTIPACFNRFQQANLLEAAKSADLNVIRLVSDPTAAAIGYGVHRQEHSPFGKVANILVYNLGACYAGVSIVEMDGYKFTVKATAGVSHVGGQDVDNRMIGYFGREIMKKLKRDVMAEDKPASCRFRRALEKAKIELSTAHVAIIDMEEVVPGIGIPAMNITRTRFEGINATIFQAAMKPVFDALHYAGMTRAEIDEIVLVGGSTQIPKMQMLFRDCFKETPLQVYCPSEAVANGVAILAAVSSKNVPAQLKHVTIIDTSQVGIQTGK